LSWAGIQRATTGSSTRNFEDDDEIGLEARELIRHSSNVSTPVIPVLTWAGIQRATTGSSTRNFKDDDEIGLEAGRVMISPVMPVISSPTSFQ